MIKNKIGSPVKSDDEEYYTVCPFCGAPLCKEQPYPGTHAYSELYACGLRLDRFIYNGEGVVGGTCQD